MAEIKSVGAREILDSRGIPTVEAEIILTSGVVGRASVPSGASVGHQEALEIRDGGLRYGGKGVLKAVEAIQKEIAPALLGHDVRHQRGIDDILIRLDESPNKNKLGANAVLAVSLAAARTAALAVNVPLYESLRVIHPDIYQMPVPLMNVMNGGAHADNNLDIQEFMIVPVGAPSFKEAVRYGSEIFQALRTILKQKKLSVAVGDEGGFSPSLATNEMAIHFILEAIESAGFKPGKEIFLALDLASSGFYANNHYTLASENKSYTSEEWVQYLSSLVSQYPILSLEDGMSEDDWPGWKLLTETLGNRVQLVGDDIFVTNAKILIRGVHEKIANAVLVKPNQIGTLSETWQTIELAKESNYNIVISHRSGETEDTFIADLAVACEAHQVKVGSLCRGERISKYNQLLRIEEGLGNKAKYRGADAFSMIARSG